MKFLLLLVVVLVGAWMLFGRRRGGLPPAAPPNKKKEGGGPQAMLACAHCGVHLPEGDALRDPAGRPFCTEAHRLAGPR